MKITFAYEYRIKIKSNYNFKPAVGLVCKLLNPRGFLFDIQLRSKQTAPLVNKHSENEVTLRLKN